MRHVHALRARRAAGQLHDERGVALLTAVIILALLAVIAGMVVYFSSSSARTASSAAKRSDAAALAEAGLANAMAILSNASTNRTNPSLLPGTTVNYETGTAYYAGAFDATNSVWTLTLKGTAANPTGAAPIVKTASAKVWTSEIVYTTTRTNGDGTTDREIWVMNLDGSGARQVTNDTWENGDAFWSPDTGTFTYESEEDTDAAASAGQSNAGGPASTNREIYTMRVDGSGKLRLTNQPGKPSWNGSSVDEDPQWGPNGKIVFDSMRNGHANSPVSDDPNNHYLSNFDVYIMNSDGTDQVNITACVPDNPTTSSTDESNYWVTTSDHTRCSREEEPAYGPGKVCIQSPRDGDTDVYTIPLTVNADGSVTLGTPQQVTNETNQQAECDWSQDGTKIAYMSWQDGGEPEIYTMNADGSGKVRLTNNTVRDEHPGWTADGRIAFNSNRTSGAVNINNPDGNEEIFVMNADGSNVTQLTFTSGITETRFPDIRNRFVPYGYSG
jgi:TolB protein